MIVFILQTHYDNPAFITDSGFSEENGHKPYHTKYGEVSQVSFGKENKCCNCGTCCLILSCLAMFLIYAAVAGGLCLWYFCKYYLSIG